MIVVLFYPLKHNKVDEFNGVFGMTNLDKLSLHLKNPEYRENAKIEVVTEERNDEEIPHIHFENEAGDFENDYPLYELKQPIETKLKTVKFKGATWQVDFQPHVAAIGRLKLMAQAHTEEPTRKYSTNKEGLVSKFGDIPPRW